MSDPKPTRILLIEPPTPPYLTFSRYITGLDWDGNGVAIRTSDASSTDDSASKMEDLPGVFLLCMRSHSTSLRSSRRSLAQRLPNPTLGAPSRGPSAVGVINITREGP